ncbi:O-antigen ligase family protein [Nigerium massiliense]|uniref:O-antigen ligase family protein n=1 Tax=Nigerium massiliense TaxID=1522317 RepID=UPI0006950232|nr:O-antigen ligase family protein [Nigerium massiliense]
MTVTRPVEAEERTQQRGVRLDGVTVFSVYVFVLLLIPSNLTISALGSLGVPGMLIGILAFAWWAWEQTNRLQPLPGGSTAVRKAALIFLVVLLMVYAHSALLPLPEDERSVADSGMLRILGMCGVILALNDGIDSRERLRVLLRRLGIAGAVMAVLAIVQVVSGSLIVDSITIPGLAPHDTATADVTLREGRVRPTGTSTNAIEFGAILAMFLPIAITSARAARSRARAIWGWLAVGLISLAALLAMSRTALICAAVAVLVMLPVWPSRSRLLIMVTGVVGLLGASLVFPGLGGTLRGLFLGAAGDPSVQSRTSGYGIATEFILQNPILGRGFATFLPKYWILDNLYLQYTVDTGLLGLAALVGILVSAMVCAYKATKRLSATVDREYSAALLAAAAAGSVSLLFFDAFAFPQSAGIVCLVVGLCGATWRLTRAQTDLDALP